MGDKYKYNEDCFSTNPKAKNRGAISSSFVSYNNLKSIKGFQDHMERDMKVDNADPTLSKFNKVLIGDTDVVDTVYNHIEGIKLRKNGVIARDLVLTTSPGFFKQMLDEDKEKWYEANIEFLKKEYGENCVYACLHLDETTPHIHALIVPKFYDEKNHKFVLRNNHYFDGIEKLKKLQDDYADFMSSRFNNLIRGIRGSKAKHIDIKSFYSIMNEKLESCTPKDAENLVKGNYLLQNKLNSMKDTLLANEYKAKNFDKVLNELYKSEKDNDTFKILIKKISKEYNIPPTKIKSMLKALDKDKKDNDTKQRER